MRLEDLVDPAKDRVRVVPGYAAGGSNISVGGRIQPAVWVDSVIAVEGDPLIVLMVDRVTAQSQAVVIGKTGKYVAPTPVPAPPREGTVSTAPAGSQTITVSTASGDVTATFLASYVPAVSDRVRLLWQDGAATVLGKVGVTPVPEPAPAPAPVTPKNRTVLAPPRKKTTGSEPYAAASSGTFTGSYGVWNSYYKTDLYQGSYGASADNTGAWFYHGKPKALKGKTITRVRVYIPARQRAGDYNSSVTLNVYRHTAERRPSGNVTRTGSAHAITIPRGWAGGWKDLPASWGADLVNGGGLCIHGGSYAGLSGLNREQSRNSGQLKLDWSS